MPGRGPDSVPRWVAWFHLTVGGVIAGLWAMLLVTRQVPEVTAGDPGIWFHLLAEFLAAILLVGAGTGALRHADWAMPVSALASGALLYTTINSAGHYADLGEWAVVMMFGLLAAATVGAIATVGRRIGVFASTGGNAR